MSTITPLSLDGAEDLDSLVTAGCSDSHSGSVGYGEIILVY